MSLGPESRLMSLDFFRGFTMFLLIGESTDIYELLVAPELNGTLVSTIGTQFHHHPWNGLRFWDLIQPFFMFIVGVAMPFSIGRRWEQGDTWAATFRHALQRSFWLLLFGWALYCIGPGKTHVRVVECAGSAFLHLSGCVPDDAEVELRHRSLSRSGCC